MGQETSKFMASRTSEETPHAPPTLVLKKRPKANMQPFDLMGLPPEVRNNIYSQMLTAKSPVIITRKKAPDLNRYHRPPKFNLEVRAYNITVTRRKREVKRYYKYGERHNVAILRANKSVYEEAHGFLLHQNSFIVMHSPAMATFLDAVAPNINLLRDVEIRGCRLTTHASVLRPLNSAIRLQRLHISAIWPGRPSQNDSLSHYVFDLWDMIRWLFQGTHVYSADGCTGAYGCNCGTFAQRAWFGKLSFGLTSGQITFKDDQRPTRVLTSKHQKIIIAEVKKVWKQFREAEKIEQEIRKLRDEQQRLTAVGT